MRITSWQSSFCSIKNKIIIFNFQFPEVFSTSLSTFIFFLPANGLGQVCTSCSVTINQRCAVCCSSWNSTVKARQAVGNDLAIQLVKRGHCHDECCECTLGRCCGKGNNITDIGGYVCKMKLQ